MPARMCLQPTACVLLLSEASSAPPTSTLDQPGATRRASVSSTTLELLLSLFEMRGPRALGRGRHAGLAQTISIAFWLQIPSRWVLTTDSDHPWRAHLFPAWASALLLNHARLASAAAACTIASWSQSNRNMGLPKVIMGIPAKCLGHAGLLPSLIASTTSTGALR